MPSALEFFPHQSSTRADVNRLDASDRAGHDWYRFILSFPPHLVRGYLARFGVDQTATVLDPFCGTGRTLVECKKHSIPSIGIEAHPMSYFASTVKLDWSPDPDELKRSATSIAEHAVDFLERDGIIDDPQPNLIHELPRLIALRKLPRGLDGSHR